MNDIEILEDIKKYLLDTKYIAQYTIKDYIKSIENIVEEIKQFHNGEIYSIKQLEDIEAGKNKYVIPKSKVKEKIEELEKEIKPTFTSIATLKRIFARQILQELLQ